MKTRVFKYVGDYLGIETENEVPLVKGAGFFFSPEDEEEIRELTKNIDGGAKKELAGEEIEKKLNTIISLAQINFGSQELQDRFRSILKVYLRGIRNRIETKQTLKKTFLDGGLGFDDDSTDEVMKIVDNVRGEEVIPMKTPVKIRLPEDEVARKAHDGENSSSENIGMRDVDYDFSSAIAKKAEEKKVLSSDQEYVIKSVKKLDLDHELAPPPPSIIKISDQPKVLSPEKKTKEEPDIKTETKKSKMMPMENFELKRSVKIKAPYRGQNETVGKKKMEDVKYVPPKIMNPIDELRYMDLVNFRRLALNTEKQVRKIKEKISLLEEEKYSKRAEAISAWRQSPVNRLYLSLGQKSISENKPIDVIIEEKKNSGEDYLTSDELKLIMDLNKDLRF
jgi:hypothetical protein